MPEPIHVHPAELAYMFSYMETTSVIGWGDDPFAPPAGGNPNPGRIDRRLSVVKTSPTAMSATT